MEQLEREKNKLEQELKHELEREKNIYELSNKLPPDDIELLQRLSSEILRPDSNYSERYFFNFFGNNYDQIRIKEFYNRFNFLRQEEKNQNNAKKRYFDDTPVQAVDNDMLTVEIGNTIFYPFKKIFIRDCYKKLYELALDSCKRSSVAIIGDPGIGKTTLIRYIFHLLFLAKEKVYWAFESGMWRYFDGENTPITGSDTNDSWKDENVILLVDGSYQEKFMPKIKNMILFCSPERSNYSKMIKVHQGRVFVMPPWSLDEVTKFFLKPQDNGEEILGFKLFQTFYDEIVKDAQKVNDYPENVSSEVENFLSESKIQNPIDYNCKKDLLLSWLKARYNLVGGRIRLLLDNNLRYDELKERVENAVLCVSPNKLSRANVLDYFSNVPSILYSLIPDERTNYRRYSIRFASDLIKDLVFSSMITRKNDDIKIIFGAIKNHNISGALMGQLFESAILKYICRNLSAELTYRKLKIDGENNLPSDKIETDKLEITNYDTAVYDANDSSKLKNIISEGNQTKNLFLIPKQSNAAQVDAIYYKRENSIKGGDKLYFFQITTSSRHSFRFQVIKKLARDIGFYAKDVNFVFIVPESNFAAFPCHIYTTTTNVPFRNQNLLKSQTAAYFGNMEDIEKDYIKFTIDQLAKSEQSIENLNMTNTIANPNATNNENEINTSETETEHEKDAVFQPSNKKRRY